MVDLQKQIDALNAKVANLQKGEFRGRKVAEELQRFNELLISMCEQPHLREPRKMRALRRLLASSQHLRFGGHPGRDRYEYDEDGEEDNGERHKKNNEDKYAEGEGSTTSNKPHAQVYVCGDNKVTIHHATTHGEQVKIVFDTPNKTFQSEWTPVVTSNQVDWAHLCTNAYPDVFMQIESSWMIGWDEGVFLCQLAQE